MKDFSKRKGKFLIFIGTSILLYLLLYFPVRGENIELKDILIKIGASIFMAFLSTYFAFWVIKFIDEKMIKKS